MEIKDGHIAQILKNIAGQKFTWFAFLMGITTITAFTTRPDSKGPFNKETTDIAHEAASENDAAPATETVGFSETTIANSAEKELPVVARLPLNDIAKKADDSYLKTKAPPASSNKGKGKDAGNAALVSYAHTLLGTPYNYGGTSKAGFDCSGFIYHVFSEFDIALQRSSRLQSTEGAAVDVAEVVPGDLLFFTGTNPNLREVGHVGIVISEPGEPVSFIHSSSNGGVKISDLAGYYTTRFMFAKRMD